MQSYENNPRSIKYHVKRYLTQNEIRIKGKKIIDVPAGNGITSRIIKELGGIPVAFDLFPEYFKVDGINCYRADVLKGLPLEKNCADMVICQEGIEHFSDQFAAFREFNRILKPGGTLLITTPNYSNLSARLSYFLSESERFGSMMPPNEIDSVWMSRNDVYFGHVFLIGIPLRVLAKLSGFTIRHIQFTRIKTSSLLLFPLAYPFIFLTNLLSYLKNVTAEKEYDAAYKKKIYREIFKLSVNPFILTNSHLFIEFIKEMDSAEVLSQLKSVHKEFGIT